MRKQLSLFVWAAAIFGINSVLCAPVNAVSTSQGSIVNLSDGPDSRSGVVRTTEYKKYETRSTTRTYNVKPAPDLYYVYQGKRTGYNNCKSENDCESMRASEARKDAARRYNLAHPFYQPFKGHVLSVTDMSVNTNSYDFTIDSIYAGWAGQRAKWESSAFSIKEDVSIGLTDNLSFIGSLRYSNSDYKIDWADPTVTTDKMSDSKIDVWGLGLQWKYVDNAKWIGFVGGYYQSMTDMAKAGVLDSKLGYKVNDTTIYGLARLFFLSYDTNSFGNGIENNVQSVYMAMETNDSSQTYFEGGAGFFTALDPNWNLDVEGVIGAYSWHTTGTIKATLGWQPLKNFGLNLYGKTTVFDTADSADLDVYTWTPTIAPAYVGTAGISNYRETSVGLQAIVAF